MNTRFTQFVAQVDATLAATRGESRVLSGVEEAMRNLVAIDDWLPGEFAKPHPRYYQQYLLHLDVRERFCVVSFVWGPGQWTPVHNHTVWGVIGMLRGGEVAQSFSRSEGAISRDGPPERLTPGDVVCISPCAGDIHQVSNAFDDRTSISIHVYGGNIGRIVRQVFDTATGVAKSFVSGYSNVSGEVEP